MPRFLLTFLLAAAALALPATASAANPVVVADPLAQDITALDGTIVWVSGAFGHEKLMQRSPDGTIAPVAGSREARTYRSIDLGRNRDGALLLTYLRCDAGAGCKALWNDLGGRRATFRNLTLPGCTLSTAPAQWRARVAYGLYCTGSEANRKRTGLYIKNGARAPVRLPRPRDAVKFRIDMITSVDLRSTRVAAIVADIYEYSFSQSVTGRNMWSFMAAASEGESDASARGLALGRGNVQWTLTDSIHVGDPNETLVFRTEGDCVERERMITLDPAAQEFVATDLAVDEENVYLLFPGTGIVTHTFTADPAVTC